MQVDVDTCYEWRPSKLRCIRGYHHYQSIWMPGLICEGNQLIFMIDTVSVVKDGITGHLPRAISQIYSLFLLSLTRKRAL